MLDKKNNKILKELDKVLLNIKNSYKKMLIKSILQNRNIKNINKVTQITQLNNKKPLKKICLKTARKKSIIKPFLISRHYISKLIKNNYLQNFQINSW